MAAGEWFDVVVGARCAGSPVAALLARAGLRVAVIEQATFPRDTLSTHCPHAGALAFLERLGATSDIRATGAPYLGYYDLARTTSSAGSRFRSERATSAASRRCVASCLTRSWRMPLLSPAQRSGWRRR